MLRYIIRMSLVVAVIAIGLFSACTKVPVGFLRTADASYTPDSLIVYRSVDLSGLTDEERERKLTAPYSSTAIQGLSGTQPISYEFYSVKASEGADEAVFRKVASEGKLLVRGGYIQLFPSAVAELPVGRYTLTLKVSNEGHEALLSDIFTFIVKQSDEGDSTSSQD